MYADWVVLYRLRIILLFLFFDFSHTSDVDTLVSKGTLALSRGQLSEALNFFSDAVDIEPQNHVILYRRATTYFAMGKLKMALNDFEAVIQINPEYTPAHKQMAQIHLKQGNFEESKYFLNLMAASDPETESTLNRVAELEVLIAEAKSLCDASSYAAAVPLLEDILLTVSMNSEFYELHGNCLLETGEIQKGIQQLQNSVHMISDNREGILRVAILMYNAGLAMQSLVEIRRCLVLDQEHKQCREHFKKAKELSKFIKAAEEDSEAERWGDCVTNARKIGELEKYNKEYILQSNIRICHCGSHCSPEDAINSCNHVIERIPQSVDFHFNKAEALINLNKLDEAIKEFQKVLEKEPNNRRAREGVERTQRLLKHAPKRDYYEILGVSRTTSTQEIVKVARKLAAKNHPDQFSDPVAKKEAEKRFIDIAAAKEVLTKPENREKFNRGIDPLDPESQGGSGSPFGFTFQNFNPFDGGNFEFHFG